MCCRPPWYTTEVERLVAWRDVVFRRAHRVSVTPAWREAFRTAHNAAQAAIRAARRRWIRARWEEAGPSGGRQRCWSTVSPAGARATARSRTAAPGISATRSLGRSRPFTRAAGELAPEYDDLAAGHARFTSFAPVTIVGAFAIVTIITVE